MKVYTAGPEVFYFNAQELQAAKEAILYKHGHEGLIPVDGDITDPKTIYDKNIEMIDSCDVVIANADHFRGFEPDSGTCFEIGYAVAKHKRVIIYYEKPAGLTIVERIGAKTVGYTKVEDFGFPLNLMLMYKTTVIQGTFEDAVKLI